MSEERPALPCGCCTCDDVGRLRADTCPCPAARAFLRGFHCLERELPEWEDPNLTLAERRVALSHHILFLTDVLAGANNALFQSLTQD